MWVKKKKRIVSSRNLLFLSGFFGLGIVLSFIVLIVSVVTAKEVDTLSFPSEDGLMITADSYISHDAEKVPFILLFHQAKWSRGEYRESALRLNHMGYNCLAVDLRSGGEVAGIVNETAKQARQSGKQTRFIDAMQDIKASIQYVKDTYHPPSVMIFGSSYSAGLVLKIAGEESELVDGVIAFSPGEYFEKDGMSHSWVKDTAGNITVPVFMTSASMEKNRWRAIYDAINTTTKFSYIPALKGQHGSRALWKRFPESDGYWAFLETFLHNNF